MGAGPRFSIRPRCPIPALLHAGEFYAVTCALLWAVALVMFRKGGETVPPLALNLFKTTVSTVLLVLTLALLGRPLLPPEASGTDWAVLLGSGALGIAVADTLLFASLNRLGAGRMAIVECLFSPSVILCSFIYLREPTSPMLLLALLLMVIAVPLGTLEWAAEADRSRRETMVGLALGAGAMFTMAMSFVWAKPVVDRVDAGWASAVRLVGGQGPLLLLLADRRIRRQARDAFRPSSTWRVTVPATLVGTYLAMFLWIMGLKYTQSNVASVLNQSSALFTVVLATLFLKERLTVRRLSAVGLGFVAAVLVVI